MNIKNNFLDIASSLNHLAQRLSIQQQGTRDIEGKKDLQSSIDELETKAAWMVAMATAYAPIIQASIDLGNAGVTHCVAVKKFEVGTTADFDEWINVHSSEFDCDTPPVTRSSGG